MVVIDEVQKVPQLLDEVHWLHENRAIRFALCGSSARKVKRGRANLLGGRAVRYELHGLTASELGQSFDLERTLNHGYLPNVYVSNRPRRLLTARPSKPSRRQRRRPTTSKACARWCRITRACSNASWFAVNRRSARPKTAS